jgi:hypothetical protein
MKKKIIYRRGVAYNSNTGKKMFCVEALVDGRWMPAFFESGFFITENSQTAFKEAARRNRISMGRERNLAAGIGDRKTEKEISYLISENNRLRNEMLSLSGKKLHIPGNDEEDTLPEINLFDDNQETPSR